jgi:hypothetical protein
MSTSVFIVAAVFILIALFVTIAAFRRKKNCKDGGGGCSTDENQSCNDCQYRGK